MERQKNLQHGSLLAEQLLPGNQRVLQNHTGGPHEVSVMLLKNVTPPGLRAVHYGTHPAELFPHKRCHAVQRHELDLCRSCRFVSSDGYGARLIPPVEDSYAPVLSLQNSSPAVSIPALVLLLPPRSLCLRPHPLRCRPLPSPSSGKRTLLWMMAYSSSVSSSIKSLVLDTR